jgi:hypothetical protein
MVVTKNEQLSQMDSKWQSMSTGRAQEPLHVAGIVVAAIFWSRGVTSTSQR